MAPHSLAPAGRRLLARPIYRRAITIFPDSPDVRVIDISRRGVSGREHFGTDLSEPSQWSSVADLFSREMKDFDGERVVFIHSAGTLQPIGFAGEVPADEYVRQVLW